MIEKCQCVPTFASRKYAKSIECIAYWPADHLRILDFLFIESRHPWVSRFSALVWSFILFVFVKKRLTRPDNSRLFVSTAPCMGTDQISNGAIWPGRASLGHEMKALQGD